MMTLTAVSLHWSVVVYRGRSAEVVNVMSRRKMDVVGLQEVHIIRMLGQRVKGGDCCKQIVLEW